MKPLKVLVVDDNRAAADALARVLRKSGDDVRAAYDGAHAISLIHESPPDIVLTDLRMEPMDGLQVLEAARQLRPPVEVIVLTAYGEVGIAVRAMHLGARDFLTKPVTVDQVQQRLDSLRGGTHIPEPGDTPDFIAESTAARRCLHALRRAAEVPSPVLLQGEVGAGRGHAALTLHRLSEMAEKPFTVMDLGRQDPWPEEGTVLLPNIDDLPDDLQGQLARRIQLLPDGVRVIATASQDSDRAMRDGKLHSKLYYAVAVVVIDIPALRKRPEDVRPLLDMHMQRLSTRYKRPLPNLDGTQLRHLEGYHWPGNVRELFNLAERAIVMGADSLQMRDARPVSSNNLPSLEPGFSLSNHLESIERSILIEALRKAGGDRNRAGELLGVARNTLRYKLNKYGLLDR